MSNLPTLSRDEYLAIEQAIAGTAKGRTFLRMHGQPVRIGKSADLVALEAVHQDLSSILTHIQQTKTEVGEIVGATPNGQSGRIKSATAELDEIVNATATATDDILSAAELIGGVAHHLPVAYGHARATIQQQCLGIFEACSFQDITGQRISKVVKTLAYIEHRLNAMLCIGAAGDETLSMEASATLAQSPDDSALLNGPQLPGQGLGQNAVDALFN